MPRLVRMLTAMAGQDFNVSHGDVVRLSNRRAEVFVEKQLARDLEADEEYDEEAVIDYNSGSAPVADLTPTPPAPATTTVVAPGATGPAPATTTVVAPGATGPAPGATSEPRTHPLLSELDLEPRVRDRLAEAMASLPEDVRPVTINDLIEYANDNDPIALPGLGRVSWAAVKAAIERHTSEGMNGGESDGDD